MRAVLFVMPSEKAGTAATQKRLALSSLTRSDLLRGINREAEKWAASQGKTNVCCLDAADECVHKQTVRKLAASPLILGKQVAELNRKSPSKRG